MPPKKGYMNPVAQKHQWKKGQSGNPKGRPPIKHSLLENLAILLQGTEIRGKIMPDGKTVGQVLAEEIVIKAIQGDNLCLKEILSRFAPAVELQQIEFKDNTESGLAAFSYEEFKQITQVLRDAGFDPIRPELPQAPVESPQTAP